MPDDTRPPLPASLAMPSTHSFVGRSSALDAVQGIWTQAQVDQGRVILVHGEAGAGKTRLATELAQRIHRTSAAVVFGRCDEDLALPYQPWVEAVRQIVTAVPWVLSDVDHASGLAPLGQLVPELGRLDRAERSGPVGDFAAQRYRLYEAFTHSLELAATTWPTLVVLDDLHWAGPQTLALLRHLVRRGLPPGMLIVGAYRDSGSDMDPPLAASLAEMRRHGTVSWLRLDHLDLRAVERFMAEAVGHDLDKPLEGLAQRMWTASGGNPFYLVELWRHLRDHKAVTQIDRRWVVDDTMAVAAVPDGVREVVAARLAPLPRAARRLLDIAALAGQHIEVAVTARALAHTPEDLAQPLDQLVASGFLAPSGTPDLAYRFAHDIVRDTVDAAISPIERRSLHLSLAEALEQVYTHDRRPVLADLARHLIAAAPLSNVDTAVYYARRAAAQATGAAAHDEAASHLASALALNLSPPLRAQLLVDLAQEQLRVGAYSKSRDNGRAAFDIAAGIDNAPLAAEAALVFQLATHFPGLHGDPAAELLRRAIDLNSGGDPELVGRLQASLGLALAIAGHDDATAIIDHAVDRARQTGDTETLLVALQAVITATSDLTRDLEAAQELERLATARRDTWNMGYGCANQCRAKIALGDLAGARADLARLHTINAVGRVSMFVLTEYHLEMILTLAAGDLTAADALAEQAMSQLADDESSVGDGVHAVQLFTIRRAQGRLAEVAPVVTLLEQLPDKTGLWRPGLAALYAELGMLDHAAGAFAELAPDSFAAVPRDALWPACLAYLTETCVALADRSAASALATELYPFSGTNLTVAFTMCFGPADRLIANLLALNGQNDEADRRFSAALELAQRSESPLWTAEVLLDWAAALAQRGEDARSLAMRREGERLAARIGLNWRRHCRANSTAEVRHADLPAGLSDREGDVLRLVADGLSNRQIGEQLFISQHTVANHIRAILRKTGSSNRTEATTFAHRTGVVTHPHSTSPP